MEFLKNIGVGLLLTPILLSLTIGVGVTLAFCLEWAKYAFEKETLLTFVMIIYGIGVFTLVYNLGADFRENNKKKHLTNSSFCDIVISIC